MLVLTEHFLWNFQAIRDFGTGNDKSASLRAMRAFPPTVDSPHRSVAFFLASFLLTATHPRYALVLAPFAAVSPHVCTPPEPSEVPRSSEPLRQSASDLAIDLIHRG